MGRVAISSTWRDLIERAKEADLPVVAQSLGFELRREGQDYRIPGHGGLTFWRDETGKWHFTHFSAGKSGDPIAFLEEYANFSFKEAVAYLTGRGIPSSVKTKAKPPRKKEEPKPDWEKWRERAEAFTKWAHTILMGPQGEAARRWLREERGINEKTATYFKLGFNPRQFWRKRSDWGLLSTGEKDRLWLPPGLVVPYRNLGGELVGLQFRLFKPNEAQKYGLPAIKGSKIRFYFLSPHKRPIFLIGKPGRPLIVLESELDAILLWQLAQDCDLSFVALGSAGRRPSLDDDFEFHLVFLTAPAVILALDADEPGHLASKRWVRRYRHVFSWFVPEGKDVTDYWRAAGDTKVLRWLFEGLEKAQDLQISEEDKERLLETAFLLSVEFLSQEENKKAARLDGP